MFSQDSLTEHISIFSFHSRTAINTHCIRVISPIYNTYIIWHNHYPTNLPNPHYLSITEHLNRQNKNVSSSSLSFPITPFSHTTSNRCVRLHQRFHQTLLHFLSCWNGERQICAEVSRWWNWKLLIRPLGPQIYHPTDPLSRDEKLLHQHSVQSRQREYNFKTV